MPPERAVRSIAYGVPRPRAHAPGPEVSLGAELRYLSGIEGGLGCTMDVIEVVQLGGVDRLLVLRRYDLWRAGRPIAGRELGGGARRATTGPA